MTLTEEELAAEIHKLNLAVDWFAAAMKERLAQKAREGFTGWDEACPVQEIKNRIADKVLQIKTENRSPAARHATDIANLAMMIWFRQPHYTTTPPPDVAALTAERDRLRKALEDICGEGSSPRDCELRCGQNCADIAREALRARVAELEGAVEALRRTEQRLRREIIKAPTANPPPCCADCGGELSAKGACENNTCKSHYEDVGGCSHG